MGEPWGILLSPQSKVARSKTGEADDTVLLDGSRAPWVRHILELLSRSQSEEDVGNWCRSIGGLEPIGACFDDDAVAATVATSSANGVDEEMGNK